MDGKHDRTWRENGVAAVSEITTVFTNFKNDWTPELFWDHNKYHFYQAQSNRLLILYPIFHRILS